MSLASDSELVKRNGFYSQKELPFSSQRAPGFRVHEEKGLSGKERRSSLFERNEYGSRDDEMECSFGSLEDSFEDYPEKKVKTF